MGTQRGIARSQITEPSGGVGSAGLQPYLVSDDEHITTILQTGLLTATNLTDVATKVYGVKFFLKNATKTLTKATVLDATSGVTTHYSLGIFDVNKNLILGSGLFTGTAGLTILTNAANPSVALAVGTYYMAWTCDTALKTIEGINFASAASFNAFPNAVNVNWFSASNPGGITGTLPSNLGTLTALTTLPFASAGLPIVLWE